VGLELFVNINRRKCMLRQANQEILLEKSASVKVSLKKNGRGRGGGGSNPSLNGSIQIVKR
jgi:hypothetical protein